MVPTENQKIQTDFGLSKKKFRNAGVSKNLNFELGKKIREPNCSKFGKRLISSCSTIFVRQLKAVVVVVGVSFSVVVVIVVVIVVVVVVVAVVAVVVAERKKILRIK